jgi:hypothetical protein
MRSLQVNPNGVFRLRRQFATCALMLSVGALAPAQSGRRTPKPQPTPDQIDKIDAEPKQPPAQQGSAPKIKVLVGRQSSPKSLQSEDQIYARFIDRLNEFPVLAASSVGSLGHKQAERRARAETDAYVVLMQFEVDSFQRGTIVIDSPDLKIIYLVFAPRTGKLKTKDKIYYQAIGGARARKDNWPNGPPLKITPAAAGIAAAERLHDWLVLVTKAQEKQ